MKMVRICTSCGHDNDPNESVCAVCFADISAVAPTSVEECSSTQEDPPSDNAGSRGPGQNSPRRCPFCSSELDAYERCPRCGQSSTGFQLSWNEIGLKTTITGQKPFFVGRVPPVEMELAKHIESRCPTVSRIHAELYMGEDGHLYLRDMGSRNGTYINKQPVSAFVPQLLRAGDKVSFSNALHAQVEQA